MALRVAPAGPLCRYRPAAGKWTAPQALSAPAKHVASPQVSVAGDDFVAAWARFDGKNLIAQTAARDPKTGAWSTPTSLSPKGKDAQVPQIAVNAGGDAVSVWASVSLPGWTIQAAYRPAGRSWQRAVSLDPPQADTEAPDVVIDSTGVATAVWGSSSGSGWRVKAASRQSDGTWTKALTLSGPDPNPPPPQLALEGSGDVTAVWSRSVGSGSILELSRKSAATGTWSPAQRLSTGAANAEAPRIATDARGDGVIVWAGSKQSGLTVMAAVRRPGKPWGKPTALLSSGSGPVAPQVALDGEGAALVVWTQSVGGFSRVQAVRVAATSVYWSGARNLSKPGSDALTAQVALDPGGDGAVAWARYDGRSFVIQCAGFDGSGPTLDRLSVPAAGVVGRRLTFSVSPRDVWSPVSSVRGSFGDGGVGSGKLISHAYAQPGRYAAQVTATDSSGRARSLRRMVTISAG